MRIAPLGIALCLFQAPAAAAPTAAAPNLAGKWAVDFGERSCSLVRMPEAGATMKLEIQMQPAGEAPSFLFGDPTLRDDFVDRESEAALVMMPSGKRFAGKAFPLGRAMRAGHGLALFDLEPEVTDALARAEGLALEVGGKRLVTLRFSGADRAVELFRQCDDNLLRAWGVDPVALRALRKRPQAIGGNMARWVHSTDYPLEAIRQNASGTTVMRFMVGTDGRPSDCTVMASSGHKSLDRVSCAVIMERGTFEPAMGPDGQPVEAPVITRLNWVIPG